MAYIPFFSDLECEENCTLEATGKVYYKGYDGAPESEILDAFLIWLESITPGTQVLEAERTASSFGGLNEAGEFTDQGSKSSGKTALILPAVFLALVGVGLAFMMHRRLRGRQSFTEEDSLIFETNLRSKAYLRSRRSEYSNVSSSDDIIVFPVSSNNLNDEFEVVGDEY